MGRPASGYKTKAKKIPVELEAEIDRLILEWKIKRREKKNG
jgi:hypothetical protein